MHDLQLSAVLHDLAAEAGQGREVGAARVQLDISEWSEGQSHAQMLTFLAADSAEVCKPLLHLANPFHLIAVCCSISRQGPSCRAVPLGHIKVQTMIDMLCR